MAPMASRRTIRAAAGGVATLCVLILVASALAAPATTPVTDVTGTPTDGGDAVATTSATDRGDGSGRQGDVGLSGPLTVVTTQGFYTGTHPGARDTAELVAFAADGSTVYHDGTYQAYFDVDPVPGTRATVEYVAARRVDGTACPTTHCSLNLVERVNLSTGRTTRVYDAVTPQFQTGRWHDVDRLNETHLLVADIVNDRVFVVDSRTEEITWQWNASGSFPPDAGGTRGDWTHLNDVEALSDGRIMAGVRNMDQVVFIDPATGAVDDAWTLGGDDDHETLFEPHNPDYIPADRGGPAVLVADSENNRVVEYRREDGSWTRTWSWRDGTLQWPRDADRLPSGNTLVVDSHGNRVLEVGTDGAVVWAVDVGRPYDAERLGTGDESATGYAAGSEPSGGGDVAGVDAVGAPPATSQGTTGGVVAVKRALPPVVVNGLLFVAPPWVRFTDLLVAGVLVVDLLLWGGFEWWRSSFRLRSIPRRLRAR